MQELTLDVRDDNFKTELLPHSSTNLKKLSITRYILHLLAALIPHFTSLTYLAITFQVLDSVTYLFSLTLYVHTTC